MNLVDLARFLEYTDTLHIMRKGRCLHLKMLTNIFIYIFT